MAQVLEIVEHIVQAVTGQEDFSLAFAGPTVTNAMTCPRCKGHCLGPDPERMEGHTLVAQVLCHNTVKVCGGGGPQPDARGARAGHAGRQVLL